MEATENTKEYAGRGTANTGLGLGIAGTALGLMNGAGNIGLGGLFGGNSNSQKVADLQSELAQIKSERYTDQSILTERDRHIEWAKALSAVDEKLHAVDEKLQQSIFNNAKDITALKEQMLLQNQIDNLRAEKDMLSLQNTLQGQINAVANTSALGIQQNAGSIANLSAVVSNLTKVVIPSSNVCNTGCGCNNSQQ